MMIFNAENYGIIPGAQVAKPLCELLKSACAYKGEKTIVFQPGIYHIAALSCDKHMLYITNTVGDEEFSENGTPHLNEVAFYFADTENITVDGNGATFIIDGKATNIAIESCENITLKNIEIRHSHPDLHCLRVVGKTAFSVDFELDRDTFFELKNGKPYFYGNGYRVRADKNAANAWWIGLVRKETPERIERVRHPFFSALKYSQTGERRIRAFYPLTSRFNPGDCYHVYDIRRQYAGIFVNKTKNARLEGIMQRFNYSLALVAQDSENLSVDSVNFSPEPDCPRMMASLADFIQLCMCRGEISVGNSLFDAAGDDCLNVHGVHFKITEVKDDYLTVRFMHPQCHGFNPLRAGDKIAFIKPSTLLQTGETVIEDSDLLNEYDIKIKVKSAVDACQGDAIEDISACPSLVFRNNTVSRIITRGLLITTRGRVLVEDNHFTATTMSGILIADDAKNWYESGMCRDVTIKNNIFDYCGETPVLIHPENSEYRGAVHKNIKIIGNSFKNYSGCAVRAKAADDIIIEGNSFLDDDIIKTENCGGVKL